jgi:hypothetical protein
MTASGIVIYIAATFIPWIGLLSRIVDICKGNFDAKEDIKILILLGVWVVVATPLLSSGNNSIDCQYWWQLC